MQKSTYVHGVHKLILATRILKKRVAASESHFSTTVVENSVRKSSMSKIIVFIKNQQVPQNYFAIS